MARCLVLLPLCLPLLTHCAHREVASASEASGSSAPAKVAARLATVQLLPLGNSGVTGSVTLVEMADGGVRLEGKVHALIPEGLHGFHAHEVGDCHSIDGASAGGHFNPSKQPHGDPATSHSHVGDFGNIVSNSAGEADIFTVKKEATLGDGPNSLIGRSLIVHAGHDDLGSQPAGNAGGRVACGVIRLSK
ncbi:MAG: superoxide dismutase family protein [Deltaproteobacteria bacterium]|nr:MAG: superoxide dismutase family protein [Deltaproteobacteria bacterium]